MAAEITLIDVVLAGSAAVTAWAAFTGASTWRAQLEGTAEFETARTLIRAAIKLRNEMFFCRRPLIRGNEFPAGYDPMGNPTVDEVFTAWAHVYDKRFQSVSEAWVTFEEATIEAQALWGDAAKGTCEDLIKCAVELRVGIESFLEDKRAGGRNFDDDKNFGKKIRAVVSGTEGDDSPLTLRTKEAMDSIEELARKHLKRNY